VGKDIPSLQHQLNAEKEKQEFLNQIIQNQKLLKNMGSDPRPSVNTFSKKETLTEEDSGCETTLNNTIVVQTVETPQEPLTDLQKIEQALKLEILYQTTNVGVIMAP
jgi:uncharacterized membrane protein